MKKFFFIIFVTTLIVGGLHGCATAPKTGPAYIPPTSFVGAPIYHTVKRGETLYRIAKTYHVEVNQLMQANRISSPSQLETGARLLIPGQAAPYSIGAPVSGPEPYSYETVKRVIGPRQYSYPWRTITVHHSGTMQGSAAAFDRDHRRRRMGGLFYHFVIGNGTNTPMGFIELGWRWKSQVKANRPYDIQICLVGNFDKQNISDAQFNTLVNLIKVLQEEYNIPISGVRQHCDIPGKHTDCPGKKFPFRRLISRL